MPYVTCPTCGERGKIPASLIGARIKCRKCGNSFTVSPPAAKPTVMTLTEPAPMTEAPHHGIEVEGLDASSWSLSTETAGHKDEPTATAEPDHHRHEAAAEGT